jgi:hypothetical protein
VPSRPFLFFLLCAFVPATAPAQWDSATVTLLGQGDTGAALAHLRQQAQTTNTPECWCALARLLTATATMRQSSWRIRFEASEAFARGLPGGDVQCLYGYVLLKEKQGTRVDAKRMLGRLEGRLASDSGEVTTAFRAELLYRRALLMDDWLRNFDFLVNPPTTVLVSSPDCIEYGYFCENFTRPRLFNERFLHSPSLASVIADQRRAVVQLLDSALRLDPLHAEAQRLRLRRALVEEDWSEFATLAARWARQDSAAVAPRLAVLAAQVHDTAYRDAGQSLLAIDSLIPDSLRAIYERFEVISRNVDPARAEEVWALSDPLYLTPENERRVQLYARLAVADIMFTDPANGITGRDTQPGKLLLRYGWPAHIWEVERDQSKETDPETMRALFGEPGGWLPQTQNKAGGRWTFFNYNLDLPSFVFERNLSEREFEYKQQTLTEEWDSTLARVQPSSYDNPYRAGSVSAVLTSFPRPGHPVLEVHARFGWDQPQSDAERVDVGVFVHDRLQGHLVNRGTTTRQGRGSVTYEATLPVVTGPLQVAVEGMAEETRAAAQLRAKVDMGQPEGLVLSDLLLADLVGEAGEVNRRADVRLVGRPDTLPQPESDLTIYWETYGLAAGADSSARYTVTVRLSETSGGRTPGGELVRVLGRVAGVRDQAGVITWERQRRVSVAGYVADVVTLLLPKATGSYRLVVTVHDDVAGTTAMSERGLTLTR